MPKPIVLMYIPRDGYFKSNYSHEEPGAVLMRALNGGYGENSKDGVNYTDYWSDYYWLVFPKDDITEPELKVFYDKDLEPINFEELRKYIEEQLR